MWMREGAAMGSTRVSFPVKINTYSAPSRTHSKNETKKVNQPNPHPHTREEIGIGSRDKIGSAISVVEVYMDGVDGRLNESRLRLALGGRKDVCNGV